MFKRIVLVLTLVGALVSASVALAATAGFTGAFKEGRGTVAFDLVTNEKTTERIVKHWEWDDLKIKCRNGRHLYDGKFKKLPIRVDTKGHFRKRAVNSWGGKAILDGQFDPKTYATAEGTFKIKGRTSVGKKCRSGVVGWSAATEVTE